MFQHAALPLKAGGQIGDFLSIFGRQISLVFYSQNSRILEHCQHVVVVVFFFFPFNFSPLTLCFLFLVSCLSPERDSKKNGKLKSEPGQDPGSDPDLVSSGQLPDQALKAVGVQPGAKHQGSVRSLLEGKEDVDIAGVELAKEQVQLSTIEGL